jgi:putative addiction module CopG family antidote
MSSPETIDLPDDLRAFAEECVRSGRNASIADVVREALEAKKREALLAALAEGIAELDAGLGVEQSVEELMAEVSAEAGLTR